MKFYPSVLGENENAAQGENLRSFLFSIDCLAQSRKGSAQEGAQSLFNLPIHLLVRNFNENVFPRVEAATVITHMSMRQLLMLETRLCDIL